MIDCQKLNRIRRHALCRALGLNVFQNVISMDTSITSITIVTSKPSGADLASSFSIVLRTKMSNRLRRASRFGLNIGETAKKLEVSVVLGKQAECVALFQKHNTAFSTLFIHWMGRCKKAPFITIFYNNFLKN